MSQYIDYDQYQQLIRQQQSPRNNLFEQNRNLQTQVQQLKCQLAQIQQENQNIKLVNSSLLNALKRVFSPKITQEIIQIIEQGSNQTNRLSDTFFEIMASHQSIPTVSDWSDSHGKLNLSKSPRKSSMRNPLSPISSAKYNISFQSSREESLNKSGNEKLIATEIMCEICDETFGPVEFISHAEKCKQLSFIGQNDDSFEDTQDRDIKKRKMQFEDMMKNLLKIRNEIEQQIKMLKFSKEKIDRAAEKRKLEKDLAKVIFIIKQKEGKIKGGSCFSGMKSGKLGKSKKNSSLKFKP